MFSIKKIGLTILMSFGAVFGVSANEEAEQFFLTDIYCEQLHQIRTETRVHLVGNSTFGRGFKGAVRLYYRNTSFSGRKLLKSYLISDYVSSYTFVSNNESAKETGTSQYEVEFEANGKKEKHLIPCTYSYVSPYGYDVDVDDEKKCSLNIIQHCDCKNGVITNTTLDYLFNGCDSVVELEKHGKLDLQKFTFEQKIKNYNLEAKYSKVYMKLPANPGLFDDLADAEINRGYRFLECQLIDLGQRVYSLQPIRNLYVNPNTYVMSWTKQESNALTECLYFPYSKDNSVYNIELDFENYGSGFLNVRYQFSVSPMDQLLGDCITSEYCIHTSPAKFEKEIGKELKNA